jgi:hypothetical protein
MRSLFLLLASGLVASFSTGCTSSSNNLPDAGSTADSGVAPDAGNNVDAGAVPDAGDVPDAGSVTDAGPATDAGVDGGDNGSPSTNYPAPHPDMPQLTNAAGGPVLTTPNAYLIFYPGYPYESDVQTFAQHLVGSTYWPATTQEYGVGAISYQGTIDLTDDGGAPTAITSTALNSWVENEIQSGQFGTPDPEAIYTIVFPSSTTITQPNPISPLLAASKSCAQFYGYHDNAQVVLTDGGAPVNFAYAVIATCTNSVEDVTSTISHEWVEASTDPFLTASGAFSITGGPDSAYYLPDQDHLVWGLLGGGEAGDLCEPEGGAAYITPADIGYEVQRTWSNILAQQSHDPCTPEISGSYFNSAPVLPETITVTSSFTGTIVTKGVTIPVGQSKTIEVDLFSDGPTNGPWTVSADDLLYAYYGGYGLARTLSFQWDRTQGVNGEKLHLTVTVNSASIVGGFHAFMITSKQGNRVTVWPGAIVE